MGWIQKWRSSSSPGTIDHWIQIAIFSLCQKMFFFAISVISLYLNWKQGGQKKMNKKCRNLQNLSGRGSHVGSFPCPPTSDRINAAEPVSSCSASCVDRCQHSRHANSRPWCPVLIQSPWNLGVKPVDFWSRNLVHNLGWESRSVSMRSWFIVFKPSDQQMKQDKQRRCMDKR